jgi:hypothetical protein
MMALWCRFSLGSIICGVALEAETNGGEVKSCQPELCYTKSCMFDRCYARLIFLGGVDNNSDKGFNLRFSFRRWSNGLTVVRASEAREQGARHGSAILDVSSCFCHRVTQWMPPVIGLWEVVSAFRVEALMAV